MAKLPGRLSPAELEVLETLWATGEATVRTLDERLRATRRHWAYTTLRTLLARLQGKGCVRSRREGQARLFRASVSRSDLIGRRLDQLAKELCGGSTSPVVQALVERGTLEPRDVARLRELVERLHRERKGGAFR